MGHLRFAVAVAVAAATLMSVGTAQASPACEPRGAAHIERHGGELADNAFHLRRGERITCTPPSNDTSKRRDNDDDKKRHRDRFGIHCRMLRCG